MRLTSLHSLFGFLLIASLMLACQSATLQSEPALPDTKSSIQNGESQFASLPIAPKSILPENSPMIISKDNGKNWEAFGEGLPADIFISNIDKMGEQLLISSSNHGLFIKGRSGEKWEALGTSLPDKKINSLHIAANTIYAGLIHHGIHQSTDAGKTWTSIHYNLPNLRVQSILEINDRLLIGTEVGIFECDKKAKSWRKIFKQTRIFSLNVSADKVIAETNKGLLLSNDQGKNWEWMPNYGSSNRVYLLEDQLIEVSIGGQLFSSHDWGKNWLQAMFQPYPLSNIFSIVKNKEVLILSNREGLLQSLDGGNTWEVLLQTENPNGLMMNLFQDGEYLYGGLSMDGC